MSTTVRPWWACTGDPCTCPKPAPARDVFADVAAERARQDATWGEQNHPDGTSPAFVWAYTGPAEFVRDQVRATVDEWNRQRLSVWRDILLEEVAEAFAETDPAKLRAELVQVAAVAVQWVQAIDRRQP